MDKIGVIGAGNMGAGIAQKMAQEGLSVILVDLKQEYVDRGLQTIRNMLDEGVSRKVFTERQAEAAMGRIKGTADMAELAEAALVVEAVFEDLDVKGKLFARLDGICGPKTIFGTNTSSLYVSKIAAYTKRPDRVVGMHYFYHPAKNRLLEVIPHEGTSRETLEKALLIGRLHGKTCIEVKDAPGFAVNRFFVPFLNESVRILEEGLANIPTIEAAAKEAFAIGMGPFELMNVTGIPIAVHSSATLGRELGPFYATCPLLEKQMEKKELWNLAGDVVDGDKEAVIERLYGTVLGVAAQLVDEGVASLEDTDRGAKIGLRWRFGPFELMNRVGVSRVLEMAKALKSRNPDFKVPALLEKQAATGEDFAFRFVDLNVADGIAYITINRPEAMNAINPDVVAQLERQFDTAEKDEGVKAIVIRGAGKAFVAGADIKFFVDNIKNKSIDKTVDFTRKGHELLLRFENSPKLTIAVLDGLSLGGGSEIALACQAIAATPAGSLGFPETGIGIYPGLGGMIRISRHVGPELAKYYVFTGRSIKASDAYELGIVTVLAEPASLDEAIVELANSPRRDKYAPREIPDAFLDLKELGSQSNVQALLKGEGVCCVDVELASKTERIISRKAPVALRVANELIDAQSEVSIEEAVELELGRLNEIFATEDALAGLSARPGDRTEFKGR